MKCKKIKIWSLIVVGCLFFVFCCLPARAMGGQPPAPPPQYPVHSYAYSDSSFDFAKLKYFSVLVSDRSPAGEQLKQLIVLGLTAKGYVYQPEAGVSASGFSVLGQATSEVKMIDSLVAEPAYVGVQQFYSEVYSGADPYVNSLLKKPTAREHASQLLVDSVMLTAFQNVGTGFNEFWRGVAVDVVNPGIDYQQLTASALQKFPAKQ